MVDNSNTALLTPSIENHLKSLLKQLNMFDYSMDMSPGSMKGDNYLGILVQVDIKCKNNLGDKTLNLMVKRAPATDFIRKYIPIRAIYEREIYMYTKVLPAITKFLEEKGTPDQFSSLAKYYSSSMDDLNETVVMQNMKEVGFRMWDRFVPLDYNHTLLVMRNYGKLHALSLALMDQKPELFKELAKNTEEQILIDDGQRPDIIEFLKFFVFHALTAFDPEKDKEAYEKLKTFGDTLKDKIYAPLRSTTAGKYAVFNHGDCWINNILFKYENSKEPTIPTKMCFIDWQLARLGSPALDLAYFIFVCTDKHLRDQHYPDLIMEYYSTLCKCLQEVGSSAEKLLPFAILQEHLKKFSVYGLYASVVLLHFINSTVDELPDVNHLQNLEEAKRDFGYESKNVDKYRDRIRGIVLDFIKYNYDF